MLEIDSKLLWHCLSLQSLFQKQARKKLVYLWTKTFFGSSTREPQNFVINKSRQFYLFFELTKILEIDAKLLEEQNVEARNKMGKNNLYSWLFHPFTFYSDAFCVEMKIQVCDHQHNVLRFGSSCSSSINEQEKDEEEEVIPKAAAGIGNNNHQNQFSNGFGYGFYQF